MKRHLKRNVAPKSWHIARKEEKYIKRPLPRGIDVSLGLTINECIKLTGFARNAREVKRILNKSLVLVNNKVRKEIKYLVGLFDVISIPSVDKYYRLIIDKKGMLRLREINKEESHLRILPITGKKLIKNGKFQVSLMDGTTFQMDKADMNVGDSLLINMKDNKTEAIKLEKGANVFLYKGKHAGQIGEVDHIEENNLVYKNKEGKKNLTVKNYGIVLGKGNKNHINIE